MFSSLRIGRRQVSAVMLVLGLTVAVPLAGCSSGSEAQPAPATTAVPQSGEHLSPDQFASAMKLPGTVLLDVRTPGEFAAGHLEGAVNLDIEAGDFETRLAALDKSVPYAVYCRSANRSGAALRTMTSQGFTKAYDLAGGIVDWQQAGRPVVTGS